MRKLLVLLVSVSLFVLCSCNSKTRIHRSHFSGHQTGIKYTQNETYGKSRAKSSGSYGFNKKINHFLPFFFRSNREKFRDSYSPKRKQFQSSSRFSNSKRRVTSRKSFWIFGSNSKRDREGSSFSSKRKSIRGSYSFNAKSRKVEANKKFFSFLTGKKRERETSGFTSKGRKMKGSYEYNSKRKRVTKKKFLFFFNNNRHEKETSTFTGGKARKFFTTNVFNKKKRKTVHKHNIFNRIMQNDNKKKKVEPELFNPKMKIKI